jgi:carbon-monoxide dehydrogenase small subunit
MSDVPLNLRANGREWSGNVAPRVLLVHLLREQLGLTGTNIGCDTSNCGACTVLMDGQSVKSCTVLAVQAEGSDVTTIEGVAAAGAELHPVQEAFRDKHALQCGYCTPGMIMSALDLLQRCPQPTERQVRTGLEGNTCRCTGYETIVDAILSAAEVMASGHDRTTGAA